ncbi:galactose mutarotase-like domain-containing protein [Microdochium trichocladiopsis]|uniref:Galactose mutarotase-like domain-containing protein n=1 Tax=Microdochium trichocladiopsis TaxID=1682393 RepID=A0A9P8Y4Y8_9PEZI|nr:galactose mutarotase-like domain-containing protein [Microdochium trichocladiopsis]KAH7029130.1 galactose mutarotase-like domain-containing protein [Microdochium trichocladiopsis]
MSSADEVSLLPLGAIIQSFKVAGTNIVQGFPTQEDYVAHNAPYFGETIGRVANRISGAKINSLNGGKSYNLLANNGPNSLHGGKVGWGKRVWDGPKPVGLRSVPGLPDFTSGGESVQFQLRSEDGDEGYPGEVLATVTYTTGKVQQDGKEATVLAMEYEVELVSGAEETVVNMTNHSYFNLTGGPSIEGTVVQLCTAQHLPVDDNAIPTGGPEPFPGVATDKPFTLGPEEPDIDHCFVVDSAEDPASVPIDTRGRPLKSLVHASHPASAIHLEVLSTEPAFQFYTGKFVNVPEVAGLPARKARSAFCVEPSRFVNAVNVDEWKNQVLLKKGEKYGARIVYKGWKE